LGRDENVSVICFKPAKNGTFFTSAMNASAGVGLGTVRRPNDDETREGKSLRFRGDIYCIQCVKPSRH
jgi:hypothetical protein